MQTCKKWIFLLALSLFGLSAPALAGDDYYDDDDDERPRHVQISRQRAGQIAVARVGGRVEDIDFERSSRFGEHYKVQVENRDGQDYKVRVSARTGRVLSVRRDD